MTGKPTYEELESADPDSRKALEASLEREGGAWAQRSFGDAGEDQEGK